MQNLLLGESSARADLRLSESKPVLDDPLSPFIAAGIRGARRRACHRVRTPGVFAYGGHPSAPCCLPLHQVPPPSTRTQRRGRWPEGDETCWTFAKCCGGSPWAALDSVARGESGPGRAGRAPPRRRGPGSTGSGVGRSASLVGWTRGRGRRMDRGRGGVVGRGTGRIPERDRRRRPSARGALERQALAEAAIRDPLTGLFNRRGLEGIMTRANTPAGALGYADLDRFKAFNDRLGHPAGDAALVRFSRLLLQTVRGDDVAAWIGGEEFAVWLPGASLERGRQVAERLRQSLGESDWRWQGERCALSASFGVAACPETAATRESLPQQADAALYRAKRGGRDRVVVAG